MASARMPAVSQIWWATALDTREKSVISADFTVRALVSFSIRIRIPSSMPYGWGMISLDSTGRSSVTRS